MKDALGVVFLVVIVYGAVFGVTYSGTHYRVDFNEKSGISIRESRTGR